MSHCELRGLTYEEFLDRFYTSLSESTTLGSPSP
jgi:hypothetical protein